MTLLDETTKAIADSGHTPEDIEFIGGAESEYACTWDEFRALADIEYDRGFGASEIATDLVILFKDKTWLSRGEYDGSEWWDFNKPPVPPAKPKKIENLKADLWSTLKEIHENKGDGLDDEF